MRGFRSFGIWGVVVVLSTVLSTLAISASDGFRVPGSSLLASLAGVSSEDPCPKDMVLVDTAEGGFCIDRYEASPSEDCPFADPKSLLDTEKNIARSSCIPRSSPDLLPWTNIPLHQAELLCSRAGKRLPSNREWYRAAMGTNDRRDAGSTCVLGETQLSSAKKTEEGRCLSSYEVSDLVGNVWEWVGETVTDGKLSDLTLPSEGYVSEVNASGIPTQVSPETDPSFGGDYFFTDNSGTRGMMRGGYWSMNERAGVFAINAEVSPTFTTNAIGFRCAQSKRAFGE